MDDEYSKVLDKTKEIVLNVGEIVKEAFEQRENKLSGLEIKENNSSNLVTETDKKVERILNEKLKELFPNYLFVGEETTGESKTNKINLTDKPTWVIDPIDGTTNFVHGFPYICISVALVVNKEPVIGVIYNPILNNMYYGQKGKGSFLNGKSLPLYKNNPLNSLSQSSIMTEYGYHRDPETVDKILKTIRNIVLSPAQAVRSMGSAALNMCHVATGNIDCYYEIGIHAWDIAAASLIVKEAGGAVVGYKRPENLNKDILVCDEPIDILKRHVLCIRCLSEGKNQQSKLLCELREKLIDFPIESD